MTRIRFRDAEYDPFALALYISRDVPGKPDTIEVVHEAKVTVLTRSDCDAATISIIEPLLRIDRQDPGLQGLMDNLWQLGIRPRDIGTPGHLAATQAHLDDMRKIVFPMLEKVTNLIPR